VRVMSEKEKLVSKKALTGFAVLMLIFGVFLLIPFPIVGFSLIFVAVGSLIYLIRAERSEVEALPYIEMVKTKIKKNKGVALWYNIQEDVPLYKSTAKYLLNGNTGRAEGFLLARIAAFMTPKWEVATLIFDFNDWVTKKDVEDVVKSAERFLLENKLKWSWIVINARGFERPAKEAVLNFRVREFGLVLTDPRRNTLIRGDTWLSEQLLKIIRSKDFKVIKTERMFK